MPLPNRNVFISHSNAAGDRGLISRLVTALQPTTFRPVLAESVAQPLAQLGEKIKDLIDSSGCFIAIVTTNVQDSQWVQQELGYAYQRHRNRDKPIAVLVQEGQSLGGFYTGLEYFSFTDETFEKTIADVVRYFEKVARGELELDLRLEDDRSLRTMVDTLRSETKTKATTELLRHIEPMLDTIIAQLRQHLWIPSLASCLEAAWTIFRCGRKPLLN